MKDLIISAASGYNPKDVSYWINSIKLSGFQGDVMVIDFGLPQQTVAYLQSKGVKLFKAELNGRHIVVERFISMYSLLQGMESEYFNVLATDIRDVVFQRNPSPRLMKLNADQPVIVASEQLMYEDEDWGNNNLRVSYPHMYDRIKEKIIFNAGVIGGYLPAVRDFFLHIYHLSLLGQDRQPDQAAMNILIDTDPFKYTTTFSHSNDGWVCNVGTTLADFPFEKHLRYSSKCLGIPGLVNEKDQEVLYFDGEVWKGSYCIVHQWDRSNKIRS